SVIAPSSSAVASIQSSQIKAALLTKRRGGCGIAAELAAISVHFITGLGRHRKLMARFANSLLRSMKQRFGHCARIRTAHRFALLFDGDHHLKGVGRRQTEYRAEQASYKILGGVLVIMKNELN